MPLVNLRSDLSWYNRPPNGVQSTNRVVAAGQDVLRISKFLARPEGLVFVAKQVGLQVTNPNTENAAGRADAKSPFKLFNPASIIGSVSGQVTGVRLARHFTVDPTQPAKYENIINSRQGSQKTANNRLVLLRRELMTPTKLDPTILTLTAATGPGGLRTVITRAENTLPFNTDGTVKNNVYSYNRPYITTKDFNGSRLSSTIDFDVTSLKSRFSELDARTQQNWNNYYNNVLSLNTDALRDNANNIANLTITAYQTNKVITTVDDESSSVKKQIESVDFESRVLKAPIGDAVRYNTLTYGNIKARRNSRTNSKVDIDFLTGDAWTQKAQQEVKQVEDANLVQLILGGINFKAYITSLTDSIDAQWDGKRDQGRADNIFFYTGFDRNVSVSFTVAIEKQSEVDTEWEKLAQLGRFCLPKYGSNGYYSTPIKVTIGNIHKSTPMLLTNVSFDWDTETPWSLVTTYDANRNGNNKPLYTNVTCDLIYLGTPKQTQSSVYFG
jgi:hypothetical protein